MARILSDTPVRSGYLEAIGGYSTASGAFVRGEAGVHPEKDLAAYIFGEYSRVMGPYAGVGLRWDFDL